jgi:hypothetical protein
MPENTISVTRPGKWGNPYKVGENGIKSKEEAVKKYRDEWEFALSGKGLYGSNQARSSRRVLSELRGKNLACWCPIGDPCHADVLLDLCNR